MLRDLLDQVGLLTPRKVLLVEDHEPSLIAIDRFLTESGHSVRALVGVNEVSPETLTGENASGGLETVAVREIEVAVLDHYFASKTFNGTTLTLELRKYGVQRILGISSVGEANRRMLSAGATTAIRKAELLRMINQ